jgi:serine protease Do
MKKMYDEEKTIRAVENISPSVVSITSTQNIRYDSFNTFEMHGMGSGIIMTPEGYILTNNHVVQGTEKVDVFLNDGKKYEGFVIGADPWTDIGVIKINGGTFYSGEFGNSDTLKPGQIAIAIGNPLGLTGGPTVTVGVISSIKRNIQTHQGVMENMIQTDTAINPGNSGGPLIDSSGKIIGINNAIIPYAQGIGFAIPINTAKDIANEIITYGRVTRPWLGIIGVDMNQAFASYYHLSLSNGALILKINDDSPAENAGLVPGDIVVEIDNKPIKGIEEVRTMIKMRKAGEKIKVKILRANKQLSGEIKLGEMPNYSLMNN